MKDQIKAKMDEHIEKLLDKQYLSTEDYFILKQKYEEMPADTGWDYGLWTLVILMFCFSMNTHGGDK